MITTIRLQQGVQKMTTTRIQGVAKMKTIKLPQGVAKTTTIKLQQGVEKMEIIRLQIMLCHLVSVGSRNQITFQTESILYSLVNVAQFKQRHDAEVKH